MSQIDGVHVVTVKDGHYVLDEDSLRNILLNEKIKDMSVAVVSVAGAFRGGKSFLLNFFLRYLNASESARDDGSWMGSSSEELTGFSWRGGSERNTTGILMWPEPYIITTQSGDKVAVLLMDTQGTFDSSSTYRDCSTIFALSTLLSSTQIYNLKENIREDDLQNLQLFTNYGKLMKSYDGKPFQVLEFLIRDWMNPYEYPYGHAGGEKYLKNKLEVKSTQPKELQELRQHIKSSFDKVTCFLMPHPGMQIINPAFKGRPGEMTSEFVLALKELASSVFSKEKLIMKTLGGQPLKSWELFNYFKSYMKIFNSDKVPSPKTILAATSEAGLLMAESIARGQFEANMNAMCGPDAKSMPSPDVMSIHAREVAAARVTFRSKKLFGEKAEIDKKLEELTKELTNLQRNYLEMNEAKTLKAQNLGIAAYDASIRELTQGKLICVHSKDLMTVHKEALDAAMAAFDANRRKPSQDRTDPEREKFQHDFQLKYEVLRLKNEQNNKSNASELKNEYFLHMVVMCNSDPKLSDEQFKEEHERSLANALEEFSSRRNRSNQYTEDPFKTNLEQAILVQFSQLKQINASGNTKAFQLAIAVYNNNSLTVAELRKHCLHPNKLKASHDAAKCSALQVFSPKKYTSCSVKVDKSDRDSMIINDLFDSRFETLQDINATANQLAVNESFSFYKDRFNEQCGNWCYFIWAFKSWDSIREIHRVAYGPALENFYGKRLDRDDHGYDEYVSDLEWRCKRFYDPENKSE